MSIVGVLYSEPSETGQSRLIGVGENVRYQHMSGDWLKGQGLYDHLRSIQLYSSKDADGVLLLFTGDNFDNNFAQATNDKTFGDATWEVSGTVHSVLLVAANRAGKQEIRLSFRDKFIQEWQSTFDSKGGQAHRNGDTTFSWNMFPPNTQGLDPRLMYLRIYQPIFIAMPSYWSDYNGYLMYDIQLYLDDSSHLRGYVARWECNVEGGRET